MEIEIFIVELIQNSALMYCLFFILGLIYYSKLIYLNSSSWSVKILLGLVGSLMLSTTYLFNIMSDSNILVLTGVFGILVTAYLFNSFLSSSIILAGMILNRVILSGEAFSFVLMSYVGLTIVLLVMNKSIKRRLLKWFLMLITTIITYATIVFYLEDPMIYLFFSSMSFLFVGTTLYFAFNYIRETKKMYYAYLKYSSKDYLTKLYNRRKLDLDILLLEEDSILPVSVAFIDVDDFKDINDTYGHNTGDEVLRSISDIILSNRIHGLSAYRLSGEEFCIIFKYSNYEQTNQCIRKIQNKIKDYSFTVVNESHKKFTVTVSIGLMTVNNSQYKIREIIDAADELMYEAKEQGKNKLIEKSYD